MGLIITTSDQRRLQSRADGCTFAKDNRKSTPLAPFEHSGRETVHQPTAAVAEAAAATETSCTSLISLWHANYVFKRVRQAATRAVIKKVPVSLTSWCNAVCHLILEKFHWTHQPAADGVSIYSGDNYSYIYKIPITFNEQRFSLTSRKLITVDYISNTDYF